VKNLRSAKVMDIHGRLVTLGDKMGPFTNDGSAVPSVVVFLRHLG
jgi:hypothetical protein